MMCRFFSVTLKATMERTPNCHTYHTHDLSIELDLQAAFSSCQSLLLSRFTNSSIELQSLRTNAFIYKLQTLSSHTFLSTSTAIRLMSTVSVEA